MTSRSTILGNLPAGTGYQVQVRAVSDVGAGPYSDVGTQITPRGMNATTVYDVVRSGVDADKGYSNSYFNMLIQCRNKKTSKHLTLTLNRILELYYVYV